jgi:hypothetical protein
MPTSLKSILYNELARNGYLSFDELREIADNENHHEETATRKMRELYHSGVAPIKNEKGHITGYKYEDPHTIGFHGAVGFDTKKGGICVECGMPIPPPIERKQVKLI